jgi:hypothetical protein
VPSRALGGESNRLLIELEPEGRESGWESSLYSLGFIVGCIAEEDVACCSWDNTDGRALTGPSDDCRDIVGNGIECAWLKAEGGTVLSVLIGPSLELARAVVKCSEE